MSDNLTFAELEAQHVELLPPRTVLSLISLAKPSGGTAGSHGNPVTPTGNGLGFNWMSGIGFFGGTGTATFGTATGGAGGTANHG